MMITDSSRKPATTYGIIYGFVSGPAHSRKLRALLETQGLRPARTTEAADILITHSAGCWLVPQNAKARLVIFIGMPLAQENPRKTWRQANWQNAVEFVKERRIISGLARTWLSIYYLIMQPQRNRAIMQQARNPRPNILPRASHVFIVNQYDPWPRSKDLDDLIASKAWAFIGMPGSHDNVWKHPDYYIPIIGHYARLLA